MPAHQWSRRVATATVGLVVAALAGGCGSSSDDGGSAATSEPKATSTPPEAVPAVVKVSIGDNFYKPKTLTVVRGQSISWRNAGGVAHTVTSDSGSAVKFDSGTLQPGAVYALKPGTVGKLTYHCTIHGTVQSGTITVTR